MTTQDFNEYAEKFFADCVAIMTAKGPDYSGLDDRLSNFKRVAESCGVSPMQVWWVYVQKHIIALETAVRTGKLSGEAFEEKAKDIANYMLLGAALWSEKNTNQNEMSTMREADNRQDQAS